MHKAHESRQGVAWAALPTDGGLQLAGGGEGMEDAVDTYTNGSLTETMKTSPASLRLGEFM